MICKKCGMINSDEAIKCSQCGDQFSTTRNHDNDIEQYESYSDSKKINILWQAKIEELNKKWKYPAFKNKKLVKLTALILLFTPAVSLLMVKLLFEVGSRVDIELPQPAPPKPNPMIVEFNHDNETKYIQQQMLIMQQLKARVEQYYQSQNKLPTLADAELQQFIANKLTPHQSNGLPTIQGDMSIHEGVIESHTQRNFLLGNENIGDIQIFMIPQVGQNKHLKWQCKIIGATVVVKGCELLAQKLE